MWQAGRLTKVQESLRPPTVWREAWSSMSRRQRIKARQEYADETPLRLEILARRGMEENPHISPGDLSLYEEVCRQYRRSHGDSSPAPSASKESKKGDGPKSSSEPRMSAAPDGEQDPREDLRNLSVNRTRGEVTADCHNPMSQGENEDERHSLAALSNIIRDDAWNSYFFGKKPRNASKSAAACSENHLPAAGSHLPSPDLSTECENPTSGHRDHTAPIGYVSTESYLLVHQPIPPKDFMKIPEAKKAVDAEWEKLTALGACDLSTVREFSEVKSQARAQGRTVHFGRVFPLCHKKNAEMSAEHWRYKGRVVFGGNNVDDQNGWGAVFSEQSTSASHHTAGKWVDALARAPGMSGHS